MELPNDLKPPVFIAHCLGLQRLHPRMAQFSSLICEAAVYHDAIQSPGFEGIH